MPKPSTLLSAGIPYPRLAWTHDLTSLNLSLLTLNSHNAFFNYLLQSFDIYLIFLLKSVVLEGRGHGIFITIKEVSIS